MTTFRSKVAGVLAGLAMMTTPAWAVDVEVQASVNQTALAQGEYLISVFRRPAGSPDGMPFSPWISFSPDIDVVFDPAWEYQLKVNATYEPGPDGAIEKAIYWLQVAAGVRSSGE